MADIRAPGGAAAVAAAWGVRERPHKGPKPALSLGRIVAAAVRVADAEGLDAVSMGRVAAELGTAPMSLYRHVSSKEELLTLMVDAAWGPAPDGPVPGQDWRAGLSRWAWTLRDGARRHPWVIRIPLSGLPIMPNEVAWFENALASLAGTGLSEARKASVIMLLAGYVRNLARTEDDIAAAIRASGLTPMEWMASYSPMLAKLADPRRFPALTAFIAAGVFEAEDGPDDEFIFGLDRILDGIAVLIPKVGLAPPTRRRDGAENGGTGTAVAGGSDAWWRDPARRAGVRSRGRPGGGLAGRLPAVLRLAVLHRVRAGGRRGAAGTGEPDGRPAAGQPAAP